MLMMSNLISLRRQTFLLAILLVLVLFAIPKVREAATINRWSLRYAPEVHNLPRSQAVLPLLPDAHPRATFWRALRALDSGDARTALALLKPLAAEGDRLVLQLMGRAYEALGDFSAATYIWHQTENEFALFRVAESATKVGDLDASLEAYSAAWELDPEGRSTGRLADFLWRKKGDPAAATVVLQQSIDNYPYSRYHLDWFRELGDVLVTQKRWAEAVTAYERFLAGIPDRFPDEGHVRVNLGWVYYELYGLEAALAEFHRAIAAAPNQPDGYFAAGRVLVREKMYNEAIKFYQESVARSPEYQRAYYELAEACYLNNQFEPAMAAIERAMQLGSTDLRLSVMLRAGKIYERAGEIEKAIAAYRQVLALDPDYTAAQTALARLVGSQ